VSSLLQRVMYVSMLQRGVLSLSVAAVSAARRIGIAKVHDELRTSAATASQQ
jgi:hypothetical protein